MPIQKETSTRLRRFGYNFETIPRQVVEQITNPVALAYYTYLLTRPDNWVVRATHLMDHFEKIGRDRHRAAMAQLQELGLAWYQDERNEKGQIVERLLMVGAIPVDDLPKVGKPTVRENPPVSKTAPLKRYRDTTDIHIGIRGWDEWVEYRKEIKKKMTPATIKKQVGFLEQYDPEQQEAIINQSIQNGWTGLFPLKEKHSEVNQRNNEPQRKLSGAERTRLARERAYERQSASRSPDMGCVDAGEVSVSRANGKLGR